MRWLMLGVVTLVGAGTLAGCSKAPDGRDGPTSRADIVSDGAVAPGVDVTAAPGVAFAYRYGFRLPADHVAAMQEAHAQACERLGIARCRIVGMRYKLNGENDIDGELDLKLAPALARAFGRDAGVLVEQAKGRTVAAEITGTDAGAQIERAGGDRARAAAEVQRLDAQLAARRGAAERAALQQQRAAAATQVVAAEAGAADARASLATTPMTFAYESGPAVRGFDTSAPLTGALDTAMASAQTTLVVVLGLLAVFGPPALAALLIWLAVRPLLAAWRRRRTVPMVADRGEAG